MTDIKRTLDKAENKLIEKKGELKGRIKQIKQDTEARSANEE
jgi:hypothetical protein